MTKSLLIKLLAFDYPKGYLHYREIRNEKNFDVRKKDSMMDCMNAISEFCESCRCYLRVKTGQDVNEDNVAEWSKALASGASPKGRGFKSRCCHSLLSISFLVRGDFHLTKRKININLKTLINYFTIY